MEQQLIDIEADIHKIVERLLINIENKQSTGIYRLYFSHRLNKSYIGSATYTKSQNGSKQRLGFYGRLYLHIYQLLRNKHHSPKLQNFVNKHGLNNLCFELIEECSQKESKIKEEYYIMKFNAVKTGFNCSHEGYTCGATISLETRQVISKKVSKALKGKTPKNYLSTICGKQAKKVLEFNNNIIIKEYNSLKEMCEINSLSYKFFSQILTGKAKIPKKYGNRHWEYK